uniref:Calponin-homology (CH) domain-containing protein n=1 Tax=Macrostomum lignano TaxID=282301 RepID=A0A1I8FCZ2_9PLAT
DILQQREHQTRAELVLQNAELVDAKVFCPTSDIVAGNSNLNLAFVANLFHKFPSLPEPGEDGAEDGAELAPVELARPEPISADENHAGFGADAFLIDEDQRGENLRGNWMNSMGWHLGSTTCTTDLRSGLTLFHLYDLIRPGIVRWPRCTKTFHRMRENFERLENCNYAVELGRQPVGHRRRRDLLEGNVTLTLAWPWCGSSMRAYTLAILSKLAGSAAAGKRIDERAIIAWANQRLERGGKIWPLLNARLVLDLIDCLRPGSVNYANVLEGTTEAERLQNAKLAINLGWRAGAKIYALPEDIVEVKPKMVMTIFACLMQLDFESPATVKLAASPVSTTSNSSAGGDSLGSGSASQQ